MMMLRIAAYECRDLWRSFQTLLVFGIFFGIAFLTCANGSEFQSSARGGLVFVNSPYQIAVLIILSSIFSLLIVPAFVGNAALKDVDHRFDGILFSLPISKGQFLFGRFTGACLAMMLALTGAPLGMLMGSFWPWADASTLGPLHLHHYLHAYALFSVAIILPIAALIFAIALVTRSMRFTYVAALGLLIFYLIVGESSFIQPLWDPFMWDIFEQRTDYWTAVERNQNLVAVTGEVLINRSIWFGLATLCFTLAYRNFAFRIPISPKGKKPEPMVSTTSELSIERGLRGTAIWNSATKGHQLLLRTRFEMGSVFKSLPFLILMGFSSFLLVINLINREVMYGVNAYPVTRLLVQAITESMVMALLGILIFYSAEVIWQERKHRVHEIMDAVPVPNWIFVVSKLTALLGVLVTVMLLGIVMAVTLQVIEGYDRFEFGLYLRETLFYFLMQFICLAILACFFQVLTKNRLVGMLFMGLFMGISIGAIDLLGFEHPLLRYGLGGMGAAYSDMNGDGRFVQSGNWLRAYWASIAGFLLMATYFLWNRGTLQPLKYRLRSLKLLKTPAFALPALLLFATLAITAATIFYNTNILNEYLTEDDAIASRATYERMYRPYSDLPMPRTVAIEMNVDLFPHKRRVEVQGTHVLQNKTPSPIEEVHFTFPGSSKVTEIHLEGGTQALFDQDFNYFIFNLETPMLPGEKRALAFSSHIQRQGFRHRRRDTQLVANGTFLHNNQLAPYVGFNPDYMLDDAPTRITQGLPPLPRVPDLEDQRQFINNPSRQDSDFVTFETTVSTSSDQMAISVGDLQKSWTEGDRRYFHYKMDKPIRNFYPYLSAKYDVARDQWQGIEIEVYYHPSHDYNVARMIQAVKDSLAYFGEHFSPYQYDQVRILEFPAYRNFAQSLPNTIPYSESMGFIADVKDDDIDMPYYVTVHEMAHQWWGFQVTAANVQGHGFIHETLAQYSALLVMEQHYGEHQIRAFLSKELEQYLEGRGDDPEGELPLYRVEKQDYIYYRKGSLVMYALRDYLGVAVVNRVLRRLIALRGDSSEPYARSTDFLTILKEEVAEEHHAMIEDWFEKITLYDLKLEQASVQPTEDGRFRVSMEILATKIYADAMGNEREVPFDIPVDIGLFIRNPTSTSFSEKDVLKLEKVRITDQRTTLEWMVDQEPGFAGVDPYHKLIDRNPEDNLRAIDRGSSNDGFSP